MSVFPLMGNFQTEIRRGYIGGGVGGGERALCTCSQVARGKCSLWDSLHGEHEVLSVDKI